jgi:hypothetical protein
MQLAADPILPFATHCWIRISEKSVCDTDHNLSLNVRAGAPFLIGSTQDGHEDSTFSSSSM